MRTLALQARIEGYDRSMHGRVVQHILSIEHGEFGLDLRYEEQPDLQDIDASYTAQGGRFWVALADERVVGTVALFNMGGGDGDLRRMFVASDHRGGRPSLAQRMTDELIDFARSKGYRRIFLETRTEFQAARKLYERNGFRQIRTDELPPSFPVGRVAEHFYVKEL